MQDYSVYKQYLDELRESGATNMYGAGAYLTMQFEELDKKKATQILMKWMKEFLKDLGD